MPNIFFLEKFVSTYQCNKPPALSHGSAAATEADEEYEGSGADEHVGDDVQVGVGGVPGHDVYIIQHILIHHQPDP